MRKLGEDHPLTFLEPYQKTNQIEKEIPMNPKVKEVVNSILKRFETGDIPKDIAHSEFPRADIPAAKWSLRNRVLMFCADTQDGRGVVQWKKSGRHVKKGAKAFYILAPRFGKKENDNGEEEVCLKGFFTMPMFRYEDTEGEPLDYEQIELPELPLIEVAKEWGLSVKAIPGNYSYYGYYSDSRKEIALATEDEAVFFHELSHAAHGRVLGHRLKPGQNWKQEIVAELSAAALCQIVGKDGEKYLGSSYKYIDKYAKDAKVSTMSACFQVISDVDKVLQEILKYKRQAGL
ncbi:MAG: hypothetical protein QG646_128 [Euryarchaeota archaeon]|nr:hypothetical protein [Euryarchaeota archaeon]